MADARPPGEKSDVRNSVPRIDEERWRAVRSLCDLERSVLCRFHSIGSCCMRRVLWAVWSNRPPGSDNHPVGAETGLLFPVALRTTLAFATFVGDARASYWPGHRNRCSASSSILVGRRGKKLAQATDRRTYGPAACNFARDTDASFRIHTLEPAHGSLER